MVDSGGSARVLRMMVGWWWWWRGRVMSVHVQLKSKVHGKFPSTSVINFQIKHITCMIIE